MKLIHHLTISMSKSSSLIFILPLVLASCSLWGKDEPPVRELVAAPTKAEQEMFQDGIDAYDRGLFTVAKDSWQQLIDGYPGSVYIPFASLKIADTYYQTEDFKTAATTYDEFVRNFPGNEAVPYARVQIANCAMKQYKDVRRDQTPLENAIKAYQDVIREHPNTPYAFEARRMIDKSRELLAAHEAYVASFYDKQGKSKASAYRYIALKDLYGDSNVAKRPVDDILGNPESVPQFEQELSSLEGVKAGPASGSAGAPSTPTLLAAGVNIVDEPLANFAPYARARLASASPEETDENESSIAPHLLQSLECEKSDDSKTIVANLSAPATFETSRTDNEVRISLHGAIAGATTQAIRCEGSDEVEAAATENPIASRGNAVDAVIKIPADSAEAETVFSLDRPNRIIAVLRPR